MEDAAAVGVVDGVADVGEPSEELAQLERVSAGVVAEGSVGVEGVGGLLEAVAADEPHGVVGPAIGVGPESVDRDDAGMLESAGDLGLEEESSAAVGVVGVEVEDLLECDLAVELGVERDEDGAESALGVGPEDAEPQPVGSGRADGVAGGAVGVGIGAGGEPGDDAIEVEVADGGERLAGGGSGGHGREAAGRVAAVLPQVQADHGLDAESLVVVEVAAPDEVVGQGASPVAGPGLEGGDELPLVDEAVLECEQTEEQVALGGDGGHVASSRGFGAVVRPSRPEAPAGGTGSAGFYHAGSALVYPPRPIGRPRDRRPCGFARNPVRIA